MVRLMASIFDLHVHTSRGSSDSSLSPEEMVSEARRLGLHGVCLAEHIPWDRHYFHRFAQGQGLLLIRGMEVHTDMGHIIVFGLDGRLPGMERAVELRRMVEEAGGFMILAHPFRGLYSLFPGSRPVLLKAVSSHPGRVEEVAQHPVFRLVDAIEAANGATSEEENLFALEVARYLGLPATGGSDAHSRHGLGQYLTVLEEEVRDEGEFFQALKRGRFYPARRLPTGELEPLGAHP